MTGAVATWKAAYAGVAAATLAVTAVTVLNGVGIIPLRDLAATPRAVADGNEWLLVTSAFVADRPVVPSIVGLAIVGFLTLALCGPRVLWTAAAAGHLLGTVVVYGVLDAASYAVKWPDYGTSAMIAAWIGVIVYHVWARGSGLTALGLCIVAALVGWLFRPDLDILDTEHAVALAAGIATAAWVPRLRAPQVRATLARGALLLHDGLLRPGGARRAG